jgi:hypothetical protein
VIQADGPPKARPMAARIGIKNEAKYCQGFTLLHPGPEKVEEIVSER